MKTIHWVTFNQSGMHRMAESICNGERAAGIDAVLLDPREAVDAKAVDGVSVHVIHTHIPNQYLWDGVPKVWVSHGTPEVMIGKAYEEALVNGAYGHADSLMLLQFWLQHADAIVTHCGRHADLLAQMSDKNRRIACVPMGIETDFWHSVPSAGKYEGAPSVFTAENQYSIKWNLDLYFAWPRVVAHPELHAARLHAIYVPRDQHRIWFPLVNRTGCSFFSYISDKTFDRVGLRNAHCSTDYYLSLVRYGDPNRMCLEAKACGQKIISYRGNPWADYWITEGDQREMARELAAILTGQVKPRETPPVPAIADMVNGYAEVYKSIGVTGG